MITNFQIVYATNNGYFYLFDFMVRVLIVDVIYFYHLFVACLLSFFKFLPLCPYLNNTGFKL